MLTSIVPRRLVAFHPRIAVRSFGVCIGNAIEKVAEEKIVRWLKEGGESEVPRHRGPIKSDPHLHVARSMNLYGDYLHSKVLADNKILPKSIELRHRLDSGWEDLKTDIQQRWESAGRPEVEVFLGSAQLCQSFRGRMKDLDLLAKRANSAIIEDSLRFGGRSPVRHAKGFAFEDRVAEALRGLSADTHPPTHCKNDSRH